MNEAFVIDGATKNKLLKQDPNSANLLKPFLEGKDLKKWHAQPRDLWLILMPKGWTQAQIGELLDEARSWQWLQVHYSAIAQWLKPFADVAQKRCDKGEFWWELRACAYYEKFEQPKIVYPVISQGAKFSIENISAFSNDKTFMLNSADKFCLGLLNSKAIWFIVSTTFSSLRGGVWRFELRGQDMEKLPIPPATPEQKQHIAQLAEQSQTLAEQRYALENKIRRRFPDLNVGKLTQKLECWWQSDFAALQTNRVEEIV